MSEGNIIQCTSTFCKKNTTNLKFKKISTTVINKYMTNS